MAVKKIITLFICTIALFSCKTENDEKNKIIEIEQTENSVTPQKEIEIKPISHATAVIEMDGKTIYLDPTGGADAFTNYQPADLVLLTDIHGDHMDAETLQGLSLGTTTIIAPQAVKDELPESLHQNIKVMNNGESIEHEGLKITAIPMYNLREEAKQFHPKGRGNGYVVDDGNQQLYIAGDTEDIPEMRNLENIDVALVPMNLPYTMPVEQAADAVLDFKPAVVYPYHFRGQDGKADVEEFKNLVNKENENIEVILANWYPNE